MWLEFKGDLEAGPHGIAMSAPFLGKKHFGNQPLFCSFKFPLTSWMFIPGKKDAAVLLGTGPERGRSGKTWGHVLANLLFSKKRKQTGPHILQMVYPKTLTKTLQKLWVSQQSPNCRRTAASPTNRAASASSDAVWRASVLQESLYCRPRVSIQRGELSVEPPDTG